ncbi:MULTISPECIES: hypothetical protein [unclassified Marinovum]
MTSEIAHTFADKITLSPQSFVRSPKVAVFPRAVRGGTKVLWSSIERVQRDRDFGRVEAQVTVVMQHDGALAPIVQTLLVGVDTVPNAGPGDLRKRLTRLAVKLAVLMPRTEIEVRSKAS